MPEAAFNAALARERLHLRSEARKAWLAVQQLQPGSPWAAEAASHAAALSSEMPGQVWPRVRQELTERIATGAPLESGSPGTRRRQRRRPATPASSRDAFRRRFANISRRNSCRRGAPRTWRVMARPPRDGSPRRARCARRSRRTAIARACTLIDRIDTATPTERAAARGRARCAGPRAFRSTDRTSSRARGRCSSSARAQFAAAGSLEAQWCDIYLAILDGRGGRQADGSARLRDHAVARRGGCARAASARRRGCSDSTKSTTSASPPDSLEYGRARDLFAAIGEAREPRAHRAPDLRSAREAGQPPRGLASLRPGARRRAGRAQHSPRVR